jgi:deaminated glutathione amidase
MRVYLARWVCLDVESNLRRLVAEAAAAATSGAELVVFPEGFLHGYTRQVDPIRVRSTFAAISAAAPGTAFLFGSFTEERRNRMTVWRGGRELAFYDKVHLFPPHNEHLLWDPGERYVAVELNGHVLGLLNCNDLRFPEQARALRLRARADILVGVAWWPWRRDHIWRALLQVRAIENAAWVIGCCVAASEHPGESFAGGGNHVFDPLGEPVRTPDDHLYELESERARAVIVNPLSAAVPIDEVAVFGSAGAGPRRA